MCERERRGGGEGGGGDGTGERERERERDRRGGNLDQPSNLYTSSCKLMSSLLHRGKGVKMLTEELAKDGLEWNKATTRWESWHEEHPRGIELHVIIT